jgi:hypothetical protein
VANINLAILGIFRTRLARTNISASLTDGMATSVTCSHQYAQLRTDFSAFADVAPRPISVRMNS